MGMFMLHIGNLSLVLVWEFVNEKKGVFLVIANVKH